MKLIKSLIILLLVLISAGCANHQMKTQEKGGEVDQRSEIVKKNAELALEHCGKGNVKKVTTDGYLCKENK